MIKATTSHGTYYVIDEDSNRAIRVPPENRHDVNLNTEGWFKYSSYSGAVIGEKMFFNIFDHPLFDYQLSTPVVSIEQVDSPIPGHFPECGWDGLVKTIASCKCYYPGMDREYGR